MPTERVYCSCCLRVTECTVRRRHGYTEWRCTLCGRVADEDFDIDEAFGLEDEDVDDADADNHLTDDFTVEKAMRRIADKVFRCGGKS